MAQKNILKAQWFWQDYNGTAWNNVQYANSGEEGLGSYVYPKGKSRPKSLFYHYQVNGIDSTKHKLDKVEFVIIIRKFKESENYLPTIKVFTGDNNAPYKTAPIKTVSSYTRRKNQFWYDEYTLAYNITGVTIAQLKNIIIEVDWKNSKVNYQTTISVNRGRLEVQYSNKQPKWSLYNTLFKYSETIDGTIGWKLTAKNTGDCGNNTITLNLPKGMSVASSSGDGSYNSSTKVWTVKNICKNESATRVFYLKSNTVGTKDIKATNNSTYAVNPYIIRQVTWLPSLPTIEEIPVANNRDDIVTYTFYDTFAKETEQYFDVQIIGMSENHQQGIGCYTLTTSNNVQLTTPLRTHVELLDSTNVDELITTSSFTHNGITISVVDNGICLTTLDETQDFMANIRVYMYCSNDNDGTITTSANNMDWTDTFPILPYRKNIFLVDSTPSRDYAYVQNSVNIGAEETWTIRTKNHRHNFFDEKKDLMEIEIEDQIAYIGVIPLSRCHKADVTADSKNTLIENRYLNRAYYGKKGDYSEKIKMTLRMAWYDVATLQGLCEMDKPIPIDTIPYFPDGDPLNHRGWAEISGVTNIKKINDMLYECDVDVTYLTHDILTKFNITEAKKITEANIRYYLSMIHDYNGDILDLFQLNYYEFWDTLEDETGNKIGSYDIDPNTSLILSRDLNKYSTYDIIYRNTLPVLMSKDYDGNWEMALRIKEKNGNKVFFEHSYNNFRHYDYDNNYVLNTANADTKYLNGNNFETLNYERINLGYDSLAPLLEDRKTATHFNTMENIVIEDPTDLFELFLLDNENKGISNQIVNIQIRDDNNYIDTFDVMTDIYGRLQFKLNFGNGDYNITATFNETDTYRACEYSTAITINFDEVKYHFSYTSTPTVNVKNYIYTGNLLNESNTGVSGMMLHYSFKDVGTDSYGYERTVVTGTGGKFEIPIDFTNGSKMLRVMFKGFTDSGTVYEPCLFEEMINVNIVGEEVIIEADDVTIIQGDEVKQYNIILKNNRNEVLSSKNLNIAFYNAEQTFVKQVTTNNMGIASIPLYLTGDAWKVDIHFTGDDTYKAKVETHNITIQRFERKETYIKSDNYSFDSDLLLNGTQDYYTIYLVDEDGNAVVDEPVSFTVENSSNVVYVDTILITDIDGKIEFPFISHSENVVVTATYNGCVRYAPCEKVDELVFANKTGKTNVTFTASTSPNKIVINEGNSSVELNDSNKVSRVIITKPSDNRTTYDLGIKSYESLNTGTFKFTIVYVGDDSFYPTMRTITYTHNTDTRLNYLDFFEIESGTGYTLEAFGVNEYYENLYKYPVWANWDCGKTTGKWYFVEHTGSWKDFYDEITIESLKRDAVYTVTSVSTQNALVGYLGNLLKYGKWGFDAYIVQPPNTKGMFLADDNDVYTIRWGCPMGCFNYNNRANATISVDGFAENGETYQDLTVSVDGTGATINQQVNEYYIIRLRNINTLEQLYFYSYLIDKSTESHLQFLLIQGDWELEIVGKETDGFKATRYDTTATINTESTAPSPSVNIFTNSDNYKNLGTGTLTFTSNNILMTGNTNTTETIMNKEYTNSNYYELTFKFNSNNANCYFIIGHDPNLTRYDGLYISQSAVKLYKDGTLVDTASSNLELGTNNLIKVQRNGNTFRVLKDNVEIYRTSLVSWNTFGLGQQNTTSTTNVNTFKMIPLVVSDITPSTEDYDGTVYGSNIHLEVDDDKLALMDYGMLPSGAVGGAKIIVDDVKLPTTDLALEMEIKYNNIRFERLNNLQGQMQMRVFEDILTSDSAKEYSKVLCSPMPVQNVKTIFTRHSEEGILYFVEDDNSDDIIPTYLCNAYAQYKGGVQITTETGIQLFNLDNAHSPVFVGNNLVRAEFHRRSGYIRLSRYDETSNEWCTVNTLKLKNNPQLNLVEYNDDYCELNFGKTTWKFYRGRPFIICNHSEDDFRVLKLVDRVYCENNENNRVLGFIEEHDTMNSIFTPQLSIQQFKQDLHIGENIREDNFKLYGVDSNGYLNDNPNGSIEVVDLNDEKAIKVNKTSGKVALNFPSYSHYVKRVGDTFSLLLDNVLTDSETSITIKARGFDDRGAVPIYESIQYGIWEQSKGASVYNCLATIDGTLAENDVSTCENYIMPSNKPTTEFANHIKVTFTDCPSEVKYLDFVVILNGITASETIIKNIMYYEGDALLNHEVDTSQVYAEQTEIQFTKTYYANLYNDDENCGLCIGRPSQHKIGLRHIYADDETVFIPYMKKASEWDKPSQVFLEYLNAKRQIVDIDWEN